MTTIAIQVFHVQLPTSSAITIAVTPVITPADRSNSPPIISSPTGTATIPKNAACVVQRGEARLGQPQVVGAGVGDREEHEDEHGGQQRAELRTPEQSG